MTTWQLQTAKSKFSQLVNLSQQEGPQIVTRHGKEVAVIISFEAFQDFQAQQKPDLIEMLLNSPLRGSGIELDIERDKTDFGRPPVEFDL